jgi:hypothetical protein
MRSLLTDPAFLGALGAIAPTVTINQGSGQADPTTSTSILFDVVFSEAPTGFATGDVTLSGTAGGSLVGTVSGSGTTYTVTVTGMTTNGTVIASIGAGVCTGSVTGLPNEASTSTDNTVTWSLQYTDDFNRVATPGGTDQNLGSDWLEQTGAALLRLVQSGTAPAAYMDAASATSRAMWVHPLTNDHFVEWDVRAGGGNISYYFRGDSTTPTTGYEINWSSGSGGTFGFRRGPIYGPGSLTAVSSQTGVGTIAGKRVRIEIQGSSTGNVRVHVDGVLKATFTDSTYTTGQYVGIRIDNTSNSVDNFTCGAL